MKVPFVDLRVQYKSIKHEIDQAIASVIADTAFVGGASNKYVSRFEDEYSKYLGVKHVVSCANGTDSIEILLEAYGIGEGDEVIVPALSWISTSEAVGRCGATPIFVDVKADTLLIDIQKIEGVISPRTKAIIPVHLYGNAVDMQSIMQIAEKHKLVVVEDCAQSHGAKFKGQLAGTFGHAASFSFYPGKNLGAYGDAGAITTDSEEIALKCRMIASHGQLEKHNHLIEGRNSRMDGIHAAILSVKLRMLDEWNDMRVKHASRYSKAIASNFVTPVINPDSSHVFHLYVIRHPERDRLKKYLAEKGVETASHYPTPLPFLKPYAGILPEGNVYSVSLEQSKTILSIPMFPEINDEQLQYVVDCLNSF
jgi:dTDP-4-amino-4,6-dideoxygalactose transaminase